MEEALQVTKTLADNCRTKGTAFRLGVRKFYSRKKCFGALPGAGYKFLWLVCGTYYTLLCGQRNASP